MAVSLVSPVELIYASLLARVKYLISKKGNRCKATQNCKRKKNATTSQTVTVFFRDVHVYEKKCMKKSKSFNTINVLTY